MTPDQRDKLLHLHRQAMRAEAKLREGNGHPDDYKAYFAADDAFLEYLFSLPVTE
jgi:hypothetical protein